ncbi:hypothetical protein NsoK4_03230 [Nitrosopumilus sp. K4]|uniref:hypothetical protein n=1 Tax=Nitrosopumilus sp. K4 TaxID=2795383 RepID=UPI001BAC25B4|nr:hypothetical protein [Nitrosopumilus sp. K4]QUC65277.1 hypothetical protein NsoK4_03230 [Nitrosopumilus sp. K4]
MNIIDLHNPSRIDKMPDAVKVLFSSGDFKQEGFTVKKVELRHYVEKNNDKLGPYSLITSFVETDKGTIEMLYDEGFRGEDALNRTVTFLVSNLGVSGLILRALISLKEHLENS